jgi:hypothetical protein
MTTMPSLRLLATGLPGEQDHHLANPVVSVHLETGVRWPVKPTNMPGERRKRPHLRCAFSHETVEPYKE